jgi:hypothetical protein
LKNAVTSFLAKEIMAIASGAMYNSGQMHVLWPRERVLLDAKHLVSILGGIYGLVYSEKGLRVKKRELVPIVVGLEAGSIT